MAVWGPIVSEEFAPGRAFRAHVQGRQESATANRHRARHDCGRNRGTHQTLQLEGRARAAMEWLCISRRRTKLGAGETCVGASLTD